MPADPATIDLVHRLPKVDLHCHLIGTVHPDTVRELARREGATWPADPATVYAQINSSPPAEVDFSATVVRLPAPLPAPAPAKAGFSLLTVTEWVADLLTRREDFVRVGYEATTRARSGDNVRHLELHVEVGAFRRRGVSYADVVDGLIEGLDAARRDVGISAVLIAAIDRSRSAAEAVDLVDEVIAHPRKAVVGIGLDNLETAGPPQRFAAAYARAARAGLRRTAHAGEHAPTADNVAACLDGLGCERIDHGYFALEDPALIERCRDEQIPFTCIFTTSRRSWRPWRRESIRALLDAGIAVVLASDDPAMFPTSLSAEYAIAHELGLDAEALTRLCQRGVDAAWLDQAERNALRADFDNEITALLAGVTPAPTIGR